MILSSLGIIAGKGSTPIVTNGLILNLDAGNTASYSGSGTTWTDLTGNGNNGTLVNGVGYSSSNGSNLTFDGVNDHVKVLLNNYPIQGPGTISIIANYTSNNLYRSLLVIGDGNGGPNPNAIQIGIRNGVGAVAKAGGGTLLNYTTPTSNLRQQWTLTFNGSNIKVFINGVLNSTTTTASNNTGLSNSLYMGTYQDAGGENFVGNISNCLIYNRVLSDIEITQNFNATKTRFGL